MSKTNVSRLTEEESNLIQFLRYLKRIKAREINKVLILTEFNDDLITPEAKILFDRILKAIN